MKLRDVFETIGVFHDGLTDLDKGLFVVITDLKVFPIADKRDDPTD